MLLTDTYSWERTCSGMKDKLTEFADNTLAEGWLGLVSAGTGFSVAQRVPGSVYKYRCSDGYHLSNKTNPDQTLRCEGTREVNMEHAEKCYREYIFVQHRKYKNLD